MWCARNLLTKHTFDNVCVKADRRGFCTVLELFIKITQIEWQARLVQWGSDKLDLLSEYAVTA